MNTTGKVTAALAGAVLTSAVLAGCGAATPDVAFTPAPVAATTSTSAALADSGTTPTPTPAPPDPAAIATAAAGTSVPADQVEAARAAGAHIYVAPAGGDGVVVVAGQPLPDVVVSTTKAVMPAGISTKEAVPAYAQGGAAARASLEASGVPVVTVYLAFDFAKDGSLARVLYGTGVAGVEGAKELNRSLGTFETHDAVLAKAQELAATYGAQVVDTTV